MTRFRAIATVAGTVMPARDGERVRIQVRRGAKWVDVIEARIQRGGYRAAVTQTGVYRALHRGVAGPDVTVR
jgi:hypothetical protein